MKKAGEIKYSLRRYENLEGNFTQISNDVFKLTNGNEFKIYSYLCSNYNRELGYSDLSLKTISENTNISMPTIIKCVKKLEKIGLIKTKNDKIEKGVKIGANNKYIIYIPNIENNKEEDVKFKVKLLLDEIAEEMENKTYTFISKETYQNNSSRKSYAYTKWREDVLKRDDYTCRLCGCTDKDTILNVHHIEKYADNEELRTNIDNGITLCCDCHKKIFGKEKEYEEYFKMLIQD